MVKLQRWLVWNAYEFNQLIMGNCSFNRFITRFDKSRECVWKFLKFLLRSSISLNSHQSSSWRNFWKFSEKRSSLATKRYKLLWRWVTSPQNLFIKSSLFDRALLLSKRVVLGAMSSPTDVPFDKADQVLHSTNFFVHRTSAWDAQVSKGVLVWSQIFVRFHNSFEGKQFLSSEMQRYKCLK